MTEVTSLRRMATGGFIYEGRHQVTLGTGSPHLHKNLPELRLFHHQRFRILSEMRCEAVAEPNNNSYLNVGCLTLYFF